MMHFKYNQISISLTIFLISEYLRNIINNKLVNSYTSDRKKIIDCYDEKLHRINLYDFNHIRNINILPHSE